MPKRKTHSEFVNWDRWEAKIQANLKARVERICADFRERTGR